MTKDREWISGTALVAVLLLAAPGAQAATAAAGKDDYAAKPASPAKAAPVKVVASHTNTIEGIDISGVWQMPGRFYAANGQPVDRRITKDADGKPAPLLPWAQAIYDKNIANERAGVAITSSQAKCLPHGIPQMLYAAPAPIQILQTPGQITFIHELGRHVRTVAINAKHDPDAYPTYFGDDVGHWEGDTLVIDDIQLTDKTTIDRLLMPHSEELHVTERIKVVSRDQLDFELTLEDPKTFAHPWKMKFSWMRQPPGIKVIEYICADGQQNDLNAEGGLTYPGANIKSVAGATIDNSGGEPK
jgi:hypothetical protein